MSKRWTMKEDLFLHQFSELGSWIGERDLGRSEQATRNRIAHLKETGAWDALERMTTAELDYRAALGLKTVDDL